MEYKEAIEQNTTRSSDTYENKSYCLYSLQCVTEKAIYINSKTVVCR